MARKKKLEDIVEGPNSWEAQRAARGLPESVRTRTKGLCYDCGEPLQAGRCGGWHSRLVEARMRGYSVEFCCKCAGHG